MPKVLQTDLPMINDNSTRADPKNAFWALIPCAGTGSRAQSSGPKQYEMLDGKPLVWHTLQAFAKVKLIQRTLLVVEPKDDFFVKNTKWRHPAWNMVRCGGKTRAQSVFNGLNKLRELGAQDIDWVLVHDAARCLITPELIESLIEACCNDPVGGLLALPLPDTLKRAILDVNQSPRVSMTLVRDDKWLAQTPQMFRMGLLQRAFEHLDPEVTDEASAVERLGLQPKLVASSLQNFKVTYPQDFALAEILLQARPASKVNP
jgi:2-C-methyl-D-erythritol 4-phosphate cytidylyltransferase